MCAAAATDGNSTVHHFHSSPAEEAGTQARQLQRRVTVYTNEGIHHHFVWVKDSSIERRASLAPFSDLQL